MESKAKNRIKEIIGEHCALQEDLCEETEFMQISLDSLSFIAAVVAIEKELGVVFQDEWLDIRKYERVGDLIAVVEEWMHAG